MARFLVSVPYPPAPTRSIDNRLSQTAQDGFFESSFVNDAAERTTGAQTCTACHKNPFLASTNTPGSGMDAPTFRGAYDRWVILPQGRVNLIDLLRLVGLGDGFAERDLWLLAGLTPSMWEMILEGRHVRDGASLFVNGRRVGGTLGCAAGTLPKCDDEMLVASLAELPQPGGAHFLQAQNSEGLFSNDLMFFSDQAPLPPRPGNLITSGGAFTPGAEQFDKHWNAVEIATNSITEVGGEVRIDMRSSAVFPWHAQISHSAKVIAGRQYTLCYDARAAGPRFITAYMDSNLDEWRNISGGQHRAHLTTARRRFNHTFTVAETNLFARIAFDLAQSPLDVQLDNIGLYEGGTCGVP